MHRKDGVYIHLHREVQREVRVYTKKEEETCESKKKENNMKQKLYTKKEKL